MDERATSAMLYLDGVHVAFDGFKAINNLSLTIAPGEMRAIIGPNGAGKTTMMDIITGKTRPDEGDVLFDGRIDLTRLDETEIAELGIGRKFQKPTVFESQSVEDNLRLALNVDHRVRRTLFWRETRDEQKRIEGVLETIRLTDARNQLAGSLSHGQKQWLHCIAGLEDALSLRRDAERRGHGLHRQRPPREQARRHRHLAARHRRAADRAGVYRRQEGGHLARADLERRFQADGDRLHRTAVWRGASRDGGGIKFTAQRSRRHARA